MTSRYSTAAEYPANARRAVRSALGDTPPELIETAELLTSELVTNAIIHGLCPATLVLEVRDDHLRVEVLDNDPNVDLQVVNAPATSEHGRGLTIVNALASSWGIVARNDGKSVWFDLNFSTDG